MHCFAPLLSLPVFLALFLPLCFSHFSLQHFKINWAQCHPHPLTSHPRSPSLANATSTFGLKWTVLAPNNGAFAKLSPYAKQYLSDPANAEILAGIITNHLVLVGVYKVFVREQMLILACLTLPLSLYKVANGVLAVKASPGGSVDVPTGLTGYTLTMTLNKTGGLQLSAGPDQPNATILQADVQAGDSVIQIIDTVLIPPLFELLLTAPATVDEALSRIQDVAGTFYNITQAIPTLFPSLVSHDAKITLFVPTDAAFAALPPALIAYLSDQANGLVVYELLTYHLIESVVSYNAAVNLIGSSPSGMISVPTDFISANLTFKLNGTRGVEIYTANAYPAHIVKADIVGGQSLIHLVDQVLFPPTPQFIALLANTSTVISTLAQIPEASTFYNYVAKDPRIVSGVSFLGDHNTKATLFVPTDQAFINIRNSYSHSVIHFLTKSENTLFLFVTLVYHIAMKGGPYKYADGVNAINANGGKPVTLPSDFVFDSGKESYDLDFLLNS